jgi:hypothetical protein
MRTATKIVVLGGANYLSYVRALAPALWYRLNEPSGVAAINSGSLGATYNGVYTACTLAQAGKVGSGSAVLFDGANSKIAVPAGFGSDSSVYAYLFNASGYGEGGAGAFHVLSGVAQQFQRYSATHYRGAEATDGVVGSSVSIVAGSTNVWRWLFRVYDNAGDRKIHFYVGAGGAVSELAYGTQTAATGTLNSKATATLTIGNETGQTWTFAGLIDEVLMWQSSTGLSLAQMQQIVRLTGV